MNIINTYTNINVYELNIHTGTEYDIRRLGLYAIDSGSVI